MAEMSETKSCFLFVYLSLLSIDRLLPAMGLSRAEMMCKVYKNENVVELLSIELMCALIRIVQCGE